METRRYILAIVEPVNGRTDRLHAVHCAATAHRRGRSFLSAAEYKPEFVTVHCDQGAGMLKEVAQNNPGNTKILAVTLLTSLNSKNLATLGYTDDYVKDLSRLVLLRAKIAREAGCQGIVCSGQEVGMIKKELPDLIAVTPGIRPAWSVVGKDDQKRVVTPGDAVRNADYIAVGRPIRDAKDPGEAAVNTAKEIEWVLKKSAAVG